MSPQQSDCYESTPAFLHKPPVAHEGICIHTHTYTHVNTNTSAQTRGGPDSLSPAPLASCMLHLWPLPRVLFICGWGCLCCGQSERQTLQLLQRCVNTLGMTPPPPHPHPHPLGPRQQLDQLTEGEEPQQPGGQSTGNRFNTSIKGQ